MKKNYEYLKNSNTGELIKKQCFTETGITGIPTYFYDAKGKSIGENLELTGFVKISQKKFDREKRKLTNGTK